MMPPKLCFIINHAAFFVSHRLPIAMAALNNGYSVSLLTGQAGNYDMEVAAERVLRQQKIEHTRVNFRSSSINPILEAWGFLQLLFRLYVLKPTIVHCASPKGVLYGGIATRLTGVPSLVLAISGMGYAFTTSVNPSLSRRLIALVYRVLAKFAFGHRNLKVIVQNEDDFISLEKSGWTQASNITLIPGSGVDLAEFGVISYDSKEKIVLFPARVLRDKGVLEFVEAARLLRAKRADWRFVIAGAADYDNPSAVTTEEVERWEEQGDIEWMGHVFSMSEIFLKSRIVCLPSYREGMPKALLEAAAAGCAVVTTDVVGCREAIEAGVTGDLVPAADANTLSEVLLRLMEDESRCLQYGVNGRRRAEMRFSVDAVINSTLSIYAGLFENAKR